MSTENSARSTLGAGPEFHGLEARAVRRGVTGGVLGVGIRKAQSRAGLYAWAACTHRRVQSSGTMGRDS